MLFRSGFTKPLSNITFFTRNTSSLYLSLIHIFQNTLKFIDEHHVPMSPEIYYSLLHTITSLSLIHISIMGPSGCGKSTLLNILGLLENPTSGEYYLNGTQVSKYTEAQRTNLRKGVIGFVFQSFNLIDELNVRCV